MILSRHREADDEKSGLTLAAALRCGLSEETGTHRRPSHHWKVIRSILRCRSGELGGHLYRCGDCGKEHFQPHSCRNRHCPTCQGINSKKWLKKQQESLLPIPYFHVVFTLPHDLNPLIQQNQSAIYPLLFNSVSQTLLEFGHNNLKAEIGITAVLHTWSQTLLDHYHLHCIVTGGGLFSDGTQWIASHPQYLFPVQALSKVFRAKFCNGLQKLRAECKLKFHGKLLDLAQEAGFKTLLGKVTQKKWVVYSKRPFAGPEQVLAYLSRYTHRVAISNRRILSVNVQRKEVTFSYKDYAQGAFRKTMTLSTREFTRRFLLHILPHKFVKIRHYGLLGNNQRKNKIAQARILLGETPVSEPRISEDETRMSVCPHCGKATLILLQIFHPRFDKASPQKQNHPVSILNSS